MWLAEAVATMNKKTGSHRMNALLINKRNRSEDEQMTSDSTEIKKTQLEIPQETWKLGKAIKNYAK